MPQARDRHVYVLTDDERRLAHGGPAIIAPDGSRHDVPVRVYQALRDVEAMLRAGMAVQLRPLRPELTPFQAAEVIDMHPDELQAYIDDGEIPLDDTGPVARVRLTDVLEFDRRLQERRGSAIQEMLDEDPWDEGDSAGSDPAR